jgi:hypothetical protein
MGSESHKTTGANPKVAHNLSPKAKPHIATSRVEKPPKPHRQTGNGKGGGI